ncbi:MAG: PIG-L deacetylase family protein [Syntrophothermus sp.]
MKIMEEEIYTDTGAAILKFFCRSLNFTGNNPYILIASAHFDDETIGLGGQLSRIKNISFIHTTDSSPADLKDARLNGCATAEEFSRMRYNEFCSAMNTAGNRMPSSVELCFRDQESSYHLPELTEIMTRLISSLNPDVVLTHPYEGGHPDHDACAFAVHYAVRMLKKEKTNTPAVVEFSSYFSKEGKMGVSDFIPYSGAQKCEIVLKGKSLEIKKKMINCYRSQQHVLKYFPVEKECFRKSPEYDFTRPPHTGKLYYENFDWGIDAKTWNSLAEKAIKEIGGVK